MNNEDRTCKNMFSSQYEIISLAYCWSKRNQNTYFKFLPNEIHTKRIHFCKTITALFLVQMAHQIILTVWTTEPNIILNISLPNWFIIHSENHIIRHTPKTQKWIHALTNIDDHGCVFRKCIESVLTVPFHTHPKFQMHTTFAYSKQNSNNNFMHAKRFGKASWMWMHKSTCSTTNSVFSPPDYAN